MSRKTDDELAAELRRGSAEAVVEIRRRVRRIVGSRAYRIPHPDRKDIEQEVMTQLWQAVNRSSFDPGKGLWGLVEVISARRCIDWLRAQRHEPEVASEIPDRSAGPLGAALARERVELARAALERLDAPCRRLIALRLGRGMSYSELATLLGKSEGALRVQLHRCIRMARRQLGREEDRSAAGNAGSPD